jgi:hypothetical protein
VGGQDGVAEDEIRDAVSEGESGFVVEPGVLAGVDAAEPGLLCGRAEAAEGACDAGESRRGFQKVPISVCSALPAEPRLWTSASAAA